MKVDTVREEIFQEDLQRYGCGYYSVCKEHDCSCRLDREIELDEKVWNHLLRRIS